MPRSLLIEADGGSRGNPGIAGYGAVVIDGDTGRVLAQRAAPLGKESNNVAEYSGLIAGLQAVLDLDLASDSSINARMDSKLVVEQMAGRWKIKHVDMRRLAIEARDLVRQIEWAGGSVDYTWIPREINTVADALSNKGMDGEHIRIDSVEPDTAPESSSQPTSDTTDATATTNNVAGVSQPRPAAAKATTPTLGRAPVFGDARTPDPVAANAFAGRPPAMTEPVRIVLVRHGVTDFTLASKLDGRGGSDPGLHEFGLRQAAAAARAVAEHVESHRDTPVSVITSSLRRAKQTGGAIAALFGVTPSVDDDWDEQNFGDWDGEALRDLAKTAYDDLLLLRADADYARPGGETHNELAARVGYAWGRAVETGGTVVIASHRKPLMCVLSRVLGIDHERAWSIATAPCSLSAIEVWPDGGVSVAFINDTHHLRDLGDAPSP